MAQKRATLEQRAQRQSTLANDGSERRRVVPAAPDWVASGLVDGMRVRCYYPPTRRVYDVSDRILDLSWTDAVDQAAVQVDLQIANYDGKVGELMVRPGMVWFIETRAEGRPFKERLRVVAFDTVANADGTVSVTAFDHLLWLQLAKGSFKYAKDKKHKAGWTCDQIAIDICRSHGVPVATREPKARAKGGGRVKGKAAKGGKAYRIVKGTKRIPSFSANNVSLYEAIAKAYMIERKESGNYYYMESDRGELVIRRRRSTRTILAITPEAGLLDGSFTRSLTDRYGTIAEPKGGTKDGSGKHKSTKKVQSGKTAKAKGNATPPKAKSKANQPEQKAGRADGAAATEMMFGAVKFNPTLAQIRDPNWTKKAAEALVEKLSRAQKTLSITALGNVHVRQGDRIYVVFPLSDDSSIRRTVFVNSVTHNVSGGVYTMELELAWREQDVDLEDPNPEAEGGKKKGGGDAGAEAGGGSGGSPAQNMVLGKAMMLAAGWPESEWPALKELWTRESNWQTTIENQSSGAYGIPQSLPASKMASAGADYRTNPRTQIKWGLDYIKERYGSPSKAVSFHDANNWY